MAARTLLVDELEVLLRRGLAQVLLRRLVDWVQHYLHHLVDHLGHQSFGVVAWSAEVRVRVDLDQPNSKVFVNHKVIAE